MRQGMLSECANCGDTVRLAFLRADGVEVWDHPLRGYHSVCGWREGMEATTRVATPTLFLVTYRTGAGKHARREERTSWIRPKPILGAGVGLPNNSWWLMSDEVGGSWIIRSGELVSYVAIERVPLTAGERCGTKAVNHALSPRAEQTT